MKNVKFAKTVCNVLDEKKSENLICLDVSKESSVCDFQIICSASSTTAVKSIAGFLEKSFSGNNKPLRVDGLKEGRWAIVDFGDVIVHIFLTEEREFYNLEKWFNVNKNQINWRS